MKRWLLFLVLFAVGLAILWLVDRGRRPEPHPEPPAPGQEGPVAPGAPGEPAGPGEPGAGGEPGRLTEVPLAKGQSARVLVGGAMRYTGFDADGAPTYRLTAPNAVSLGDGLYRLDDAVVRFFVPGSEDRVRLEVSARAAKAKFNATPTLELDPSYPIEFEDVVATLHEGSPFVPVTVRVPRAVGVIAEQRIDSNDRVDIRGTGLTADGQGFAFRGKERELRLLRDTHANVVLADGTPAKVSAAGGLTLTGLEELGRGATRVVAREAAHLEFEGKEPLVVDADVIEMDARIERGEDTRVLPTTVAAHGSVVLAPRDGKFFGDDARLELLEDGRPSRARLTGSPRVELRLRGVDTSQVPGVPAQRDETLEVRMSGAGPLDVRLEGDASFDFVGPATLELPSLAMTLTAQEKLSGTRAQGGEFARLEAAGAVEARSGTSVLTAPALSVERRVAADGEVAAVLVTNGATHANGPLSDGGAFDLLAANGLEFVRLAKSFQVPIARDVELTVTGPHALSAKAREVRDLDEATRSFTGIGDVEFKNARGTGRGEHVVVRGPESAELVGAPGELAHAEFEQGALDARRIDFQGDVLRAEGEAHARVGLPESTYELDARWISVTRTRAEAGQELLLESGGDVRARVEDAGRVLDLSSQTLEARAFSKAQDLRGIESRGLVATGAVKFDARGDQELSGEGERLEIDADRRGRLQPAAGERIRLHGKLPQQDITFEMTSAGVEFSPESLTARDPAIEILGLDLPVGKDGDPTATTPLRAVAGSLSVDSRSILFTEGAYVGQTQPADAAWSLDAEKLAFSGQLVRDPPPEGSTAEPTPRFVVSTVLAWNGFRADFARKITARGSTLLIDRDRDRLTMRGDPAEFLTQEQQVSTEWLEFDLATGFLRTASGTWSPPQDSERDFVITFASMEPAFGLDSRVQVVRELNCIDRKRNLVTRASWALFWLDDARIQNAAGRLLRRPGVPLIEPPEPRPAESKPQPHKNKFVKGLLAVEFTDWVREAYLEGNIEVLDRGDRTMRADAMYMNLVDGHGWVRDVEIIRPLPISSMANRAKLSADWVSYSPDGSSRAEHALATTCDHEEPHYWITLEDVRISPRLTSKARKARAKGLTEGADETDGVDILARGNSLHLGNWIRIPLPRLPIPVDEEGNISIEYIPFLGGVRPVAAGSSARFGLFIGAAVGLPQLLGRPLAKLIGDRDEKVRESFSLYVNYLKSRGLLLTLRNRVRQQGFLELDTQTSAIYDDGRDRGLVRVPADDRDSLRAWLRMEGRRWFGTTEWIDMRLTKQTDPGVQAEYFEGDFLRWEERETYVHWRKARGLDYFRATAETQLDDFRTEVLELPSVGYTRARAEVTRWWGYDLLYTSDTGAAHLKRIEGDPLYEPPFPDGFGEEEVLRFDTDHRWELAVPLGVLDARLVPFVEARGTFWDRGAVESEGPSRLAAFAGAETSTTFWRLMGDGDVHSLIPTVGVRSDLIVEENGPVPATFDAVEGPVDGTFFDFGLRSRWVKPLDPSRMDVEERFLDIEVRETYAADLSGGRRDGWLPLRVNAQWLTELGNIPFGVTHDARYDLDTGDAEYSRTLVGIRPLRSVEIETGFHSARDLAGDRLYSAWSLAARYSFSDKWQIEGKETINSLSGSQLESGILVRRIGHDFVFEIEYSLTAGEGGGSLSFALTPMLGYRQRRFGYLSEWQRMGN